MKPNIIFRYVVFGAAALALVAGLPFAIRHTLRTGEIYIFSRQFLLDLPKRLTGPGRFRFVLQPAVAIFLGVRAGIADARAGRTPYIFSLLMEGQQRWALFKEGCSQVAVLVAMSVLLDAVSQFLILRQVYPGAALLIGPVLIATPYSISRALANRASRQKGQFVKPTDA